MSNNVIESTSPKVLIISPFTSNIANKMKLLASSIVSDNDGDNSILYIECYTKEVAGQRIKTVRLSDVYGTWTEFSPHDKIDGDMLDTSVAVNMYDFYNATDNCFDEMMTLWVDNEDNELVFNSFYNSSTDVDDLEIRFKILDKGFPFRNLGVDESDTLMTTFSLDATTTLTIMKELNVENLTDGVLIAVIDGKIRFQSYYNGITSQLTLKSYNTQIFTADICIYIPFNVFQMMTSTGHVYDLQFKYYESGTVILTTDEYGFKHSFTPVLPLVMNTEDAVDYFIIDSEMADTNIGLINRLNKSGKMPNVTIEKVDEYTVDFTCNVENRMSISVRTGVAMLSDVVYTIDSDIFTRIVTKTNLDAIKFKLTSNHNLYVKKETGYSVHEILYDHEKFTSYRTQKLSHWEKTNA